MHHLSKVIEKHSSCIKCPLSTQRIANKQSIVFFHGMFMATGLVIIPKPVYKDDERPASYGASAEEIKIIKSIWNKVGLDPDDWILTTAIGCKGEITKENVDACSERLSDIIHSISPKIIVTCGHKSAYAFTKKAPPKKYGWQPDSESRYYQWLHTYDFSDYLENKDKNPDIAMSMAEEMMSHWESVKIKL